LPVGIQFGADFGNEAVLFLPPRRATFRRRNRGRKKAETLGASQGLAYV
jgi:hypothetical protein